MLQISPRPSDMLCLPEAQSWAKQACGKVPLPSKPILADEKCLLRFWSKLG